MIGSKLSEITGYENISMYVKFLKRDYVKDLLDGNIFMNSYDYFIDLEKKTKKKGQGDKLEVAHVVRSNSVKMIDKETGMVIATASSGEIIERYSGMEKLPLFCVTHLHSNDFIVTKVEDDIITAKINLPQEDIKLFETTFGDTAVILSNEFENKMIKASSNSGSRIVIGDVSYQNYQYYSSQRSKEFDELSINVLLWKDSYFKHQREARFVLIDKPVEDSFILQIGEIRDKSKVLSTKELLTDTEFELALL